MLSSISDFTTRKAMPQQLDINSLFAQAFNLLQNSSKHLFITGKAGSGKSTLLKYCVDNCNKNIVVLAPTGIAALNVKGQTIHRFFNFPINVTPEQISNYKITPRVKRIYKLIDTIIIDEVSMLRADILDCIDVFLRIYGPQNNQPFGGIQMVFIGDLYQLPPVISSQEQSAFYNRYQTPYFFSAEVFPQIKLTNIELTKIYRQKDSRFIDLLGRIRNNTATNEDILVLNTRLNITPPQDDFVISLATTNKLAEQINQKKLLEINDRSYISQAVIDGEFNKEYFPTTEILELKPGAQIMFLNNDTKKRWVNGSLGKIENIKLSDDKIRYLRIRLAENKKIVDVFPYTWEIYKYSIIGKEITSEVIGSFTQYPLRLAWAVTIHKSQGQTFDNVLIDIGNVTFANGQLYVALSRCTSLHGIYLKKALQKKHILTDNRISCFMNLYFNQTISQNDKISLLEKAAAKHQKIEIRYQKSNNEISHRIIIPIRIKENTLLAFCLQRGEQRSFKLENIIQLSPFYEL